MSLVLNVEILGEFKKLTGATQGAAKDLKGLNTTVGKISKGMKTALGAIGVGFSLSAVITSLKDASEAAIEDRKSQELLSKALKDNLEATDNQVAAVEAFITKAQLATGVSDDNLRPAFSKLALSSGSLEESMDLLSIATDTAAGTGKDLDTVAQAMAKALEGNTGSLEKLVPSIKDAKDPIQALADTFSGAATAAANTDPYTKMKTLFGELQEQVGTALLPYLNQFSTWLSEPGTTEMLQEIVDVIVDMIKNFGTVIGLLLEYKDVLVPIVTTVGLLAAAWKAYNVVNDLTVAGTTSLGVAMKGALGPLTLVVAALQTIDFINSKLMANGGWSRVAGNGAINFSGSSSLKAPNPSTFGNMAPGVTVNQNITVNSASTNASGVVSSLQAYQNQTGATLSKLLK